jgi:glycosyltransferase involved in cell wall biosynthesis
MRRVVWATIATRGPMGQQRYENEIQAALAESPEDWSFDLRRITSARSPIEGAARVPARLNQRAPLALSRLIGSVVYGRPDLVHRFDLRLPAAAGVEVVTVHDLPPLRFPDEGQLATASAAGARRAVRVICPSRFAADEVSELLGVTEIDVIPYGVSADYADSAAATDDELAALGIDRPFVLHAAGASARKNLPGLAAAWRDLSASRDDLLLVLCGPPDGRRDEAFAGLPRVVKTGRLESPVVAALMRRASAVVVPSVYEGFGLPALEGMVCGAPVVAAARGALPEVCGDAALLVEPEGEALAAGLRKVLDDSGLADQLRQVGPQRAASFSWARAAEDHLETYRKALAS